MIELKRVGRKLESVESRAAYEGSLKMLFAGICGTDVQILRGDRADTAEILGHEGVAWDPINRRHVGFNPVATHNQDLILGHSLPGLFRSNVPIEYLGSHIWPQLVELNPKLSGPAGVLVEPLGACLYSWDIIEATIGTPKRVAVWGGGVMGHLNALEATRKNIDVTLVHPRPSRLDWSRNWFSTKDITLSTELCDPRPIDVAILAVPRTAMTGVIERAVFSLRDDGLLVLVGGVDPSHSALPGIDLRLPRRASVSGNIGPVSRVVSKTGRSIIVTGHRGTSHEQLLRAQSRLICELEAYCGLVTHVVQPEEVNSVLDCRVSGNGTDPSGREVLKIVVDLR